MAASTVRRRGTDSSGRGIYATDYMWSWWQGVCKELGFTPVITQGAWMLKAGGGADDSKGYHDGGGTFDLRVWNLTDAQVAKTIRVLRRHGAGAYLRNEQHGGFDDPHIHFVLGSDYGLSAGAKQQWAAYVTGRDGLASNGADYHWRPSPLVLRPPKVKPGTRYVTANMAWQLGGDKALLLELAESADVLMLVECRTRDNKPLDVAKILGPDWDVQQTLHSASVAGSVTAVREHIPVRRTALVPLSPAGKGVQARHQRVTVIDDDGPVDLIVFHNPLPSTGKMRSAETSARSAVRRARLRRVANPRRRWIQAGDANTTPQAWAKVLRVRHYFGVKPMVVCWSAGWGQVDTDDRRVAGSDHAVLTLTTKES